MDRLDDDLIRRFIESQAVVTDVITEERQGDHGGTWHRSLEQNEAIRFRLLRLHFHGQHDACHGEYMSVLSWSPILMDTFIDGN